MASSSSSPMKALFLNLTLAVVLLINCSEAKDYPVGGHENMWKIPSSEDVLDKWGQRMRFLLGDSLVIKYDPKVDSVLQVDEQDYKNCNKTKPIKTYNDGNTKIKFDKSGPYYFISGANGHCEKGEKLSLRVLAAKHGSHAHPPASSPANSPAQSPSVANFNSPAPAPVNGGFGLKAGILSLALVLGSIAALV